MSDAQTPSRPVGRGKSATSSQSAPGTVPQLDQLLAQQARLETLIANLQQARTPSVDDARPQDVDLAPVSLSSKLPEFWAADPVVWFGQIEAIFATRNITQQLTKFHYVISSLSPEYAAEVRDLILSPPTHSPYDTLKSQLIQRTQASEHERLRLLLSTEELGDQKPSALLRRMQQLMGEHHMDDALFRELFEQKLPGHVRMVLASSSSSLQLSELAQLADRILEVAQPSPLAVHSVATNTVSSEITALKEQMEALTTTVKELAESQHRLVQQSRVRGRSRGRGRSPTPHSAPTSSAASAPLCYYHQRFGNDAFRCTQPCSFSGNAPAGQ